MAEVLYKKQKWFRWVRACQDTEEKERDNEKVKVKAEAALFKRHEKDRAEHLRRIKEKEYALKQDAVLEQAYLDSLSLKEREEQEAEWDPIEAVMEDERASYIDLIRHFLFLTDETQSSSDEDATGGDGAPPPPSPSPPSMRDPVPISALLSKIRSFSTTHGDNARFTLPRFWSAPHFYPLMLGLGEKRVMNAFTDCVGRVWEWGFVPKDMPYCNRSMQFAAWQRVAPFLRKGLLVDAADEGGVKMRKGEGTEFYDEDDGVVYPGRDPRIAKGRKGRGVYAGEREGGG